MHRWIREEIIKYLLSSLAYVSDNPVELKNKALPFAHTQEIHHGLAEWYWKLFMSSRDPQALCESIYHRCWNAEAALWAASVMFNARTYDDQYDDDIKKNLQRAENSMLQAEDSIQRGRPELRVSLRSRAVCRMLTNIREKMVEPLRTFAGEKGSNLALCCSERFFSACERVLQQCLEVQLQIAREVSEHKIAYDRQFQLGSLVLAKHDQSPPKSAILRHYEISKCARDHGYVDCSNWLYEIGILHLVVRNYKGAGTHFIKVCNYLIQSSEISFNNDKPSKHILDIIRQSWNTPNPSDPPMPDRDTHDRVIGDRASLLAKALRRLMQLRMLQGDSIYLRMSRENRTDMAKAEKKRLEYLKEAEICKQMAVEVLRFFRESLNPGKYDYEQCRLRTQLSLVNAHQGHFPEAQRRLTEAASNVNRSDTYESDLRLGVIDLHRAEILCIQVAKMKYFVDKRHELVSLLETSSKVVPPAYDLKDYAKTLAQIHALLRDATDALNRAKHRLSIGRNVWWICNYYFLRLKVMEFQLTVSIFEPSGLIPGFGLEAAPRGTQSEPESLLEDLGRMVRRDVLAYARGFECFVRMVRLLKIRLRHVPMKEKLHDRLRTCEEAINHHRTNLQERLLERCETHPFNDPPLDSDILQYVQHVISMASR